MYRCAYPACIADADHETRCGILRCTGKKSYFCFLYRFTRVSYQIYLQTEKMCGNVSLTVETRGEDEQRENTG